MTGSDHTDDVLLQAWWRQRDESALEELCRRHASLVRAACRWQGSPDPDEAAQAVILVLARRAGSVPQGSLVGWLLGIVRRVVGHQRRAMVRRIRHEREAAMASSTTTPPLADEPAWAEAQPHLADALASLSPGRREAVVRYYLQGMPQAEVAAELGCSVDAVKTRVHEALERLRVFFARRGVTLGGAALAAGLAHESPAAEPALANACLRAAITPGGTSAALASGVITTMFISSAAIATVAGMVASSALAVALLNTGDTPAAVQDPPPAVAPAPAPLLSEAQRAAILALYAQAVQAGLPDAAGGTLVVGDLTVTERLADPAGRERTERCQRWAHLQANRSMSTVNGYSRAVHLRLPDGRWLLHLVDPQPAEASVASDATGRDATPQTLAAIARQGARQPPQWDKQLLARLSSLVPAERERAERGLAAAQALAGMHGGVPVSVWSLHLLRLGVPEADGLIAGTAALSLGCGRFAILAAGQPLRLGGASWRLRHTAQRRAATAHPAEPAGLAAPTPETFTRQMLAAWFYDLLLDDGALTASGLRAAQAAEAAKTFCPVEDRDIFLPQVERLLASRTLPQHAQPGADLAARLQAWLPGSEAPAPESEVAGLIALLDDPRPVRWLDGPRARPLGDHALRAIATILGCDPRLIVRRDLQAAWTPAERQATAAALRTWWTAGGSDPLDRRLQACIAGLPVEAAATLIRARSDSQRAGLVDALVAAWRPGPPTGLDPYDVAAVLRAARNHPGLDALVRSWPVEGGLRPLLACWRDRHGDPAALDTLLRGLAADGRADVLAYALTQARGARMTPERMLLLTQLAGGDVASPVTWAAFQAIGIQVEAPDADWEAVVQLPDRERNGTAGRAMRLALAAAFAADRREIPSSAVRLQTRPGPGQTVWGSLVIAGTEIGVRLPRADAAVPTGLRVCDLTAKTLLELSSLLGLPDADQLRKTDFDPWAEMTVRDRTAQRLATACALAAGTALAEETMAPATGF